MQPELLKFQAFGPYVEEQQICFQDVANQHLFLIRGETGSGKTVILDAMTYALYGRSSGGQRDTFEQMRSRYVTDEIKTYVDFQFQLHGHHYRFYRSVEVKQNRKNEKQIKVKIDAGEMVDGQFCPFFENPKMRNVEDKANALIGLNYEQFVQVMLLPQGKFEQFLTSRSEDKQAILKTLFQMDRYTHLMDLLTEKIKVMRERISETKKQQEFLLQQLGLQHDETMDDTLLVLTADITLLQKKLDEVLVEQNILQKEQIAYERYVRWINDKKRFEEEAASLKQQKSKMEEHRKRFEQYQKVKDIETLINREIQTKEDQEKRTKTWDEAKKTYENLEKELKNLPTKITALEDHKKQVSNIKQLLQTYEQSMNAYIDCEVIKKELKIIIEKEQKEQQILDTRNQQQMQEQEQYTQIQTMYTNIQSDLITSNTVEAEWKRYASAYVFYQKQSDLVSELRIIEKNIEQKQQLCARENIKYNTLQLEHEQLYQLFLEHSASLLAADLIEEKPCPVCGSLHHPNPAQLTETLADVHTLREKKQALDKQQKRVENANQIYQEEKTIFLQKTMLSQQFMQDIEICLQHSFDIKTYEELKHNIMVIEQKRKQQLSCYEKMESYQKRIEENTQQIQKQQQIIQEVIQQHVMLETRIEGYKQRFIEGINDVVQLRMAIQQLQKNQQTLEENIQKLEYSIQHTQLSYEKAKQYMGQAQDEYVVSTQQYQLASTTLNEAMQVRYIAYADRNLLQQQNEMKLISNQLTVYDQAGERLRALQKEHEEQGNHVQIIQGDHLKQKCKENEQQRQSIQEQLVERKETQKRMQSIAKQLANIEEQLKEQEPYVIKMAAFVYALRGDNSIGLERYVLGTMLAQITKHANQLLNLVHHGRYQLYRSDVANGRTRKSGLELEIYDSYTCSYRNVASLSGGEKFLVSLALSLALSMVVQMRNGGIRFEAMFIDEGFGSLDEHSIADALQVLQTMASSRGMVGIISHVDVLKENIPQGIEVVKTRKGSFIKIRNGEH